MALQRAVKTIAPVQDGRYCLFRITKTEQEKLEKHLYRRYPRREWGSFFRFGFRRTSWGLALSYVDGLWPEPGDLDRRSPITTFTSQYTLRVFRTAERQELGIGVIHSHPQGCWTSPSDLDDDMDGYYSKEFMAYSGGFSYCSLIFQRDADGRFSFTGRVFDRGEWLPVREMLTVGFPLQRELAENFLSPNSTHFASSENEESTTARLESLFEVKGQERLSRSTVGVIGCSGTGSPTIHVLARARVGNFVVVDPQRLGRSNLERLHGSIHADLCGDKMPYKVELMRRMILAINPQACVTALVGNVLDEDVLHELLRCDLLLGCSDTQHARVMLSDLAKHYLIPSIDVGVLMEGATGKLTAQLAEFVQYAPDLPCVFCCGRIDAAKLAEELMSEEEMNRRIAAAEEAKQRGEAPDQYWRGRAPQLHTVGYMTTTIGSLAAGYAEGWLTGAFPLPYSSFQFDIGQSRFGFVEQPRFQRPNCVCGKTIGWADQARSFRNVAKPQHWPKRALRLS
jgi:molybdopterin/thiamine biosynthesis adenylyltransferase/proteasome lid subunit RPN8/RPN11